MNNKILIYLIISIKKYKYENYKKMEIINNPIDKWEIRYIKYNNYRVFIIFNLVRIIINLKYIDCIIYLK